MGKLVRLELYNFKSYKGHHVMLFGDSYFTSVIGPNGSGKSNSMDAISFVLGIKSSHLRSTHLRDLVYRGRVLKHSRIAADGTATEGAQDGDDGQAEEGDDENGDDVETQESTQRNDPTTAWVMAVYEDDAGDEQAWKRSITSSGQSEYRINDRVVTAKQYNDALENENILIKARNFLVFQGDVEAVASQSARDLTRLIEQISGSLEYKADYDRLKEEAEKADEEQRFKLDQRRSINSEVKQYQEQKREADDYNRKADEKDRAVVTHVLWKLYHFQRVIEQSGAEIERHNEELKEHRRNVESYQTRLEEAMRDQAKTGRAVSKIERDIKRKEKDVEEKENGLVPIDEKISISNKKAETSRKRVADIQKKEMLSHDRSMLSEKIYRRCSEPRPGGKNSGVRSNSKPDEYNRLRGEVTRQVAGDQIRADNITRQLRTDEETVNSLKSKVDFTQTQIERLENEISELESRRSEVNSGIRSTKQEIDAKKRDFNALTSERLRTNQKRTELDEKLREVLYQIADARGARQESEKEARARETVAEMKRIYPGVKGQLWSLCRPKQKKYAVAVSTVLGRHHDSIVVDTEKTAKDCIDYLRDKRAGQATFIPLDTIIHKAPDSNLKGMHRGMRLAVDTVEYDNSVERAIFYALGNSIVCDDLDIARHLRYERRVDAKAVTLDGTIIHKADLMTGGQGPNDARSARRWDDAELRNSEALKDRLEAELRALPINHQRQAEEETLQGELSGLEARRSYAEDELQTLDRNIASKRRELEFAQGQLAEATPKYNEQSQGLANLRAELETFTASISEAEDAVFAAFCQRLGYPNIRAYEAQQGSAQQEASQKNWNLLRKSLAFETQRLQATEDRITRLENDARSAQQTIEELEAERESLNSELDTLNAELEQLNEQLSAQKAKYDERAERVAEQRREMSKRSKNVEATTKAITALETEVQKAGGERYQLLRRCRIEEISIPLTEGSNNIDSIPLEGVLTGEEADPDTMDVDEDSTQRGVEVQDFGIKPDFDELDDDLKEDNAPSRESQLLEAISELQSELDKMAPNTRAVERLEGVENRLRTLEKDYQTAMRAANRAKKAFEDVRQKREDTFKEAFEYIRDNIDRVYKDLTKTASFPLGGVAALHTEDDDEPYLSGVKYHAMPPLKRFRDMEHLSGGEKTMAALALLFAIHTYKPSPFFVLDEVDAALDHANTVRLANYVREHAGPGMQFIVISLKTGLFQNSETLVGVMRDQGINSSRALTLDLRKYQAV
ncbi:Structural maintenance of chromosomes protein 1 [Taxawa tesnikishii (nom. ined.)]|nr:Structural maintenance of chromosomes protein 1 [Dothideales sp. JES 119]